MRIPVYRTSRTRTGEAPGRSIQARMDPSTFANAELRRGQVGTALASAVGEYAETRYKVITENRLNEALLGAEETLRTRANELAESADYYNALDGEDPIWMRETREVRDRLLDGIGGDVYARQQFEARFGQLELQNRFRLRSAVDSRVRAAAAAGARQNLELLENRIANGIDLAEIDLATRSTSIALERGAAAGGINYADATAAQQEAIRRGLTRATTRMAGETAAPVGFVDGVRRALTSGDISALDANGMYLYGAMQGMTAEEQAGILTGSYRTVNFMFAETQEEEMLRRQAEAEAAQVGEQVDAFIDDMASGMPVSQEGMAAAISGLAEAAPFLSPEARDQASNQIRTMEYISGLANTLNAVSDPAYVRNLATTMQTQGLEDAGLAGVDTDIERAAREFITNYATRMEETIATDPLTWARNTNAVDVGTVDVSAGAIQAEFSGEAPGATGLTRRVSDARRVAARYNVPVNHIFGAADAAQVVSQIDLSNFEVSLGQIRTIADGLGDYAEIGIRELEQAGLAPELVQAMYVDSPLVQRELVQIAGVDTAELRGTLPTTTSNDIGTELNTQLENYFAAFEAGGGAAAIAQANSQLETAQRLAFLRARGSTQSAAQIAEGVIADLFPPETNWVREPRQLYIVPKGVDANQVQIAAERMMTQEALREAGIKPLENPLFPEYVDLELNIFSLSSIGVWLNNSTGDGLILHYDFDGSYLPALREDGQPYQMLFSEAASAAQAAEQERMERVEGMMTAP